jgi:hypothetical protein
VCTVSRCARLARHVSACCIRMCVCMCVCMCTLIHTISTKTHFVSRQRVMFIDGFLSYVCHGVAVIACVKLIPFELAAKFSMRRGNPVQPRLCNAKNAIFKRLKTGFSLPSRSSPANSNAISFMVSHCVHLAQFVFVYKVFRVLCVCVYACM